MSHIKWLQHFLFLEKLLGIYRNYCRQKKIGKSFIIFQIIVQTLVHTSVLVNELCFLLVRNKFSQIKVIHGGFSTLSYGNALTSVVTGICYSQNFISYIKNISQDSEYFQEYDFIYSIKKIYRFSIISTILCFAFSIYRSTQIFITYMHLDGDMEMFIFVSVFASQTVIRFTIVFQKIMLFFVIMVVVERAKCLNSMLSAVQDKLRICIISSDVQCDITKEHIQGWVKLYRDLAESCQIVTLVFGRQFIISVMLSMSYYMLLTNHMCNKNVSNDTATLWRTLLVVSSFLSLTMLPIIAGQWTHNQGIKFYQALARLYNTMIIIDSREAEARLIKDFIRLIKKNPLQIKLLSNTRAGMYLLPLILTLAVNYIIVIMQFNNVF